MADLGAVTSLGSEILHSIMTAMVYAIPFFFVAVLLIIVYFFIRKRKLYGLDCIIYTIADNNLVQGRDKGGVIKNALGLEEFRFKKRKKGCPVPNRKHWVMQDNGKFCLHFYRHSDDDFEPIEATPDYDVKTEDKTGVMDKIKSFVQKDTDKKVPVPLDDSLKTVDMKSQFKGLKFTPIKSDSKQYLNMKAKEIVYKNKIQKKMDQWKPVIMYGSLIIGFIILVIWYFKYAGVLAEKQLNCISPEMCKQVAQEVYGLAKDAGTESIKQGFKTPFG